ncbi:hypothetical protein N0V82_001128 [Gnomoniopsis sp. IMI 355080]|nr:hypothetical protein N0V82_001128 [Gnomoniopsis sp. IMI 355080]
MHVLISGVGVAGPAVAFFLAKAGVRVTVVEKAPKLLSSGQNIDVSGTAISVIKKMGLMDQLRNLNTREVGTRFVNDKGQAFASFPMQKGSSASLTAEFEVLRGDLAKMLYEPTTDHPNVDYLFNTTVTQVLTNDDSSVKVELSTGDVNEYDALVVADGQWSKLRKDNFPPEDLKIIDTNMYAAYCTIPRLPTDDDWWNIHVGLQSRIVTVRPDPYGTYRAMFTRMPCNAAQKQAWQEASRGGRKMQQELLRREFAGMGWHAPRILDAMGSSDDFYFHAIQQIKMSKWWSNRIVLIGDAAYCPTPLTGMGASLAINGAYVLAGELSKLEEGEHPRKAFQAYDARFRGWVEKSQWYPPIFPSAAHPASWVKRWAFESAIWAVSRLIGISWVASRIGADQSEEIDDFKLPQYSKLDSELS